MSKKKRKKKEEKKKEKNINSCPLSPSPLCLRLGDSLEGDRQGLTPNFVPSINCQVCRHAHSGARGLKM
jgi:hypothetical protein